MQVNLDAFTMTIEGVSCDPRYKKVTSATYNGSWVKTGSDGIEIPSSFLTDSAVTGHAFLEFTVKAYWIRYYTFSDDEEVTSDTLTVQIYLSIVDCSTRFNNIQSPYYLLLNQQ